MENQHRQIRGYRELNQAEIDLMNEIKQAEARVLDLQARVADMLIEKKCALMGSDLLRFNAAEPGRWAAIAKTDFQTGFMALVRAVAQPVPEEVSLDV